MGKDKPILFSSQMVRAILNDAKYSTMRIMRRQPPEGALLVPGTIHPTRTDSRGNEYPGPAYFGARTEDGEWCIKSPYESGDRLWVKESAAVRYTGWNNITGHRHQVSYRADCTKGGQHIPTGGYGAGVRAGEAPSYFPNRSHNKDGSLRWHPSLFMPRWASRITLPVATVLPKRVQDLTIGEICREGLARNIYDFAPVTLAFKAWEDLWVSLNGRASWDANPWCWMINFAVIKENIDKIG